MQKFNIPDMIMLFKKINSKSGIIWRDTMCRKCVIDTIKYDNNTAEVGVYL